MKFAVVVFPGIQLRPRRVSRGEARARPAGRVRLAQGHRPERRRRRHPARRLRARRLPAHRRDRALLADHARGAGVRRRAAGRCSASATASRSCSRPACCRARCCAIASLKFRCEHVHVRVEQTDTPFTGALPRRARCCGFRSRTAKATTTPTPDVIERLEAQPPGRLPLRDADGRGRRTRRTRTARVNDIAGICNERRNVVGLMPHPERACEPALGSADGLRAVRVGRRSRSSAGALVAAR